MQPMAAGALCWVDGTRGATLSPFDRGVAFGDGLFETMRFAGTRIPLLDLHLARLARGGARLGIPIDETTLRAEIDAALQDVVAMLPQGVLKLILTRGAGGRGYRAAPDMVPTRVLLASPLPENPPSWTSEGVVVRFCEMRLGANPLLAGIKHLNRLEQVMARREWDDPDIAEGLLADARGRVVEGIATNIFVVSGGRLMTPPIESCGVAGVMREYLVSRGAPALGIPLAEAACERAVLGGAQELFLCNSVIGVWPVRRLAARDLPVGPVTRRIQAHVAALFAA
jgi:4-amino-4-deoxychorismate lyase